MKKLLWLHLALVSLGKRLGSLERADRKRVIDGATIFRSLCASCHGTDAKGLPTNVAPSIISIVLHGSTGTINRKKYPTDMPALGSNNDEWAASVLSYLRYNLGVPEQYAYDTATVFSTNTGKAGRSAKGADSNSRERQALDNGRVTKRWKIKGKQNRAGCL